jgi:Cytochrome c oxidase subunit IIa family
MAIELRTSDPDAETLAAIGHPRGTLAVVVIFALFFALAWFAAYLTFLGRGTPHH